MIIHVGAQGRFVEQIEREVTDKITWFASFGPYESPRYAVVVMVESGGSGGGTCAPVARAVYQALLDREKSGPPNPAPTMATSRITAAISNGNT